MPVWRPSTVSSVSVAVGVPRVCSPRHACVRVMQGDSNSPAGSGNYLRSYKVASVLRANAFVRAQRCPYVPAGSGCQRRCTAIMVRLGLDSIEDAISPRSVWQLLPRLHVMHGCYWAVGISFPRCAAISMCDRATACVRATRCSFAPVGNGLVQRYTDILAASLTYRSFRGRHDHGSATLHLHLWAAGITLAAPLLSSLCVVARMPSRGQGATHLYTRVSNILRYCVCHRVTSC